MGNMESLARNFFDTVHGIGHYKSRGHDYKADVPTKMAETFFLIASRSIASVHASISIATWYMCYRRVNG